VDRGRGKRRASRIFAEEGIAAKGSVQHDEETQDSLRVRRLCERENEERWIEFVRAGIGDGWRLPEHI